MSISICLTPESNQVSNIIIEALSCATQSAKHKNINPTSDKRA